MTENERKDFAPLCENRVLNKMNVDDTSGLPKYDFMTAKEVGAYLGIGKSQAYDICKKINEKLAGEGYLTFRGKVPRKALLDQLPKQETGNE